MFRDILDGIRSYGTSLSLIKELNLWKYMFVPALISLGLLVLIGSLAWVLSDDLGNLLVGWYPWEWGREVIEGVGYTLSALLIIALGLILYKTLVMILAGPFMSPLSEKIEKHMSGFEVEPGFNLRKVIRDMVRGIRLSLRYLVRELFFTILIILGSLFFPFIAPAAPVLILLIQSYYAGAGNMDFTLERHFRVKGSIQFVRDNRGLALGNGVVFILILMTGIGFLFALPFSAVASTVETVKRMDGDEVGYSF